VADVVVLLQIMGLVLEPKIGCLNGNTQSIFWPVTNGDSQLGGQGREYYRISVGRLSYFRCCVQTLFDPKIGHLIILQRVLP